MLGARWVTDVHARSKNGHPPQSTTGVANKSWIQLFSAPAENCRAGIISDIAKIMTAAAGPRLTQKRLLMSRSSAFGRSSNVTILGSSAMPQTGHAPGLLSRTSGSIGQMYSTLEPAGAATGAFARCAGGVRNGAGSRRNFSKHPVEQK